MTINRRSGTRIGAPVTDADRGRSAGRHEMMRRVGTPRIEGFGHIDLTVTDGARSAQWWAEVLGFKLLLEVDRPGFRVWSMLHPSGLSVGLMTHQLAASTGFDERAVGLDHLAFNVRDRATLEEWARHFDALGVAHSEIKDENGGPAHDPARSGQHPTRAARVGSRSSCPPAVRPTLTRVAPSCRSGRGVPERTTTDGPRIARSRAGGRGR
jgi:glyoxylase I family protein